VTPKLVFVYGTRPEAIKIAPIVAHLPNSMCIATGQHVELLRGSPAESDLAHSLSLELKSEGQVGLWIAKAVPVITEKLKSLAPIDIVVVQGDTMSAYAGSIAAFGLGIPVAHIEAGLRSHNLQEPWPEERIRTSIAQRATYHFAPTETARKNLWLEGIEDHSIFVLGNPVVSAIHRYANPNPIEVPDNQILVTMHRREWTDRGKAVVLKTIYALLEEAQQHPTIRFLWPMHPGVQKISGIRHGQTPGNVQIIQPLDYRTTIDELRKSIGVATDSGGLCEEAVTLGVPCTILRNLTDRPEAVSAGLAKLFSPTPDGIKEAIRCLARRELPRTPSPIYGSKDSANLIADQLQRLSSWKLPKSAIPLY
jgi:UDP-N-acetylglucosamine 2-epimerase (non-hydrolysing)